MNIWFFTLVFVAFKSRFIKNMIKYQPLYVDVHSIRDFDAHCKKPLASLRAFGNTSSIHNEHPVVQAILLRYARNTKPGMHKDSLRIGLAIEGGGMRGCVAAGASAALNFLGLDDCFDVVYGSSAGAMIAAYFISRQPSGVAIYHDLIPAAGRQFVDKLKILHASGISWRFPWLLPTRSSLWSNTHSVLKLQFLLDIVMGNIHPLEWNTFSRNEQKQPIRIVTSSLKTLNPVILSRDGGHFTDLSSLLNCIRASMLVPGICGKLMAIGREKLTPFIIDEEESKSKNNLNDKTKSSKQPLICSLSVTGGYNNRDDSDEMEPIVDALLCEPIPFRSAVLHDKCTHVVVLRTRPDPCPMLGRGPGFYERFIASRFFRHYATDLGKEHLMTQQHQYIYARDVLTLNDACHGPEGGVEIQDGIYAHLLPIAPSSSTSTSSEVSQLESKKDKILCGMRDGARRVFEIFGPELGINTAHDIDGAVHTIFPDSILSRPADMTRYANGITIDCGRHF